MILIFFVLLPPVIGWLFTDGEKVDFLMLYGIAAVVSSALTIAEFLVPDGRCNEGRWWTLACSAVLWFAVYVLSR
jgi:hypothetical protein